MPIAPASGSTQITSSDIPQPKSTPSHNLASIITYVALAIILGGALITCGTLGIFNVSIFSSLGRVGSIALLTGGAVLAIFFSTMAIIKSKENHESAPYFHIHGSYDGQKTNAPPIHTQLPEPLRKALENLDTFYVEILSDLASKQDKLTPTQCLFAMRTILGLSILEKNREHLASIPDEDARTRRINELTQMGAEEGLVQGNDRDLILCGIDVLVNQLKEAYRFDKDKNDTVSLFREGFSGAGPCFNGKMISLSNYIRTKQQKLTETCDRTDYDDRACVYMGLIYNCQEALGLKDEIPSKEAFKSYVEGILAKKTLQDALMRSELGDIKRFNAIYSRAREITV